MYKKTKETLKKDYPLLYCIYSQRLAAFAIVVVVVE